MTRRSIFGVPMSETSNRLWETDSVFGHWSCDVQETVNDLERVEEKVAYFEWRLALLLRKNGGKPGIVDSCVRGLRSVDGRISIGALERHTGYSRCYLDRPRSNV